MEMSICSSVCLFVCLLRRPAVAAARPRSGRPQGYHRYFFSVIKSPPVKFLLAAMANSWRQ